MLANINTSKGANLLALENILANLRVMALKLLELTQFASPHPSFTLISYCVGVRNDKGRLSVLIKSSSREVYSMFEPKYYVIEFVGSGKMLSMC